MKKSKLLFVALYGIIITIGLLFVFITPYYISNNNLNAVDLSNDIILDIVAKGKTYFGFLLIIIGVSGLFLEKYSIKKGQ